MTELADILAALPDYEVGNELGRGGCGSSDRDDTANSTARWPSKSLTDVTMRAIARLDLHSAWVSQSGPHARVTATEKLTKSGSGIQRR